MPASMGHLSLDAALSVAGAKPLPPRQSSVGRDSLLPVAVAAKMIVERQEVGEQLGGGAWPGLHSLTNAVSPTSVVEMSAVILLCVAFCTRYVYFDGAVFLDVAAINVLFICRPRWGLWRYVVQSRRGSYQQNLHLWLLPQKGFGRRVSVHCRCRPACVASVAEVILGTGGVLPPLIVGSVRADLRIMPQFAGVCSKSCCCLGDVCEIGRASCRERV